MGSGQAAKGTLLLKHHFLISGAGGKNTRFGAREKKSDKGAVVLWRRPSRPGLAGEGPCWTLVAPGGERDPGPVGGNGGQHQCLFLHTGSSERGRGGLRKPWLVPC